MQKLFWVFNINFEVFVKILIEIIAGDKVEV